MRTELRTSSAQFAQLLRNQAPTTRFASARFAVIPAVTRPQCVNMLREALAGEGFAQRPGARRTCAKHCEKLPLSLLRPLLQAGLLRLSLASGLSGVPGPSHSKAC